MESKNIGQVLKSKSHGKNSYSHKKGVKKFWKRVRIVMYTLLGLIVATVVFIFVIDSHVEKTGKEHELTVYLLDNDYDCVIVPGAAVYQNSIPSPMLQDRLDMAVEIYQKKIAPKILVSGDHGKADYDEVSVMRSYLIDKGIPSGDIFMDYAGFDTYQTLYRARDIFQVKKAVIATQDFHLYRALYIGEKLSLDLDGVDSAVRDYHNSSWNRAREYLARVKAFLECEIFKPAPKFLGETIPIHGAAQIVSDAKSAADTQSK